MDMVDSTDFGWRMVDHLYGAVCFIRRRTISEINGYKMGVKQGMCTGSLPVYVGHNQSCRN